MKNFLFYLGHPAHFHLFKNVIKALTTREHHVNVLIKKKDILESLLTNSGLKYVNILPEGRKSTKSGIAVGVVKRFLKMLSFCLGNRPDILIGTSVEISYVGKILGIPSINVNEDDAEVVPLYSKLAYPFASIILTPKPCQNGKWENKAVKYAGNHELAYLHPNHFTPNKKNVEQYFPTETPYFIIRFAKLSAHHDAGKTGITSEVAEKLIKILEPYGKVFISSERELEPQFENYRLNINPLDIHHAIYFATMYIGDSQTMAAEAGVLGTPFIRFNDFVGRIGYLEELENKFELGCGFKPSESNRMYSKIYELLKISDLKSKYQKQRQKVLSEKIDVTAFMVWFFENYPVSAKTMKDNPDYQWKFK